jgi:hypothetical protein
MAPWIGPSMTLVETVAFGMGAGVGTEESDELPPLPPPQADNAAATAIARAADDASGYF